MDNTDFAADVTTENTEMSKEEALEILMAELEKGWRSGEEEGWIPVEEVRAYFENHYRK
ncbi:MAG: hypothetical protein FWC67_02315 [Defluviitaleaceae bacterium]|nr:hypothetical protein [Defluviitaleaceae bacterium]